MQDFTWLEINRDEAIEWAKAAGAFVVCGSLALLFMWMGFRKPLELRHVRRPQG